LHCCDCDSTGHALPPYAAGVTTVRVCDCSPPPHALEQVNQLPHSDTTQSTGHGSVPHARTWLNDVGHAAPPCAACCVIVRVCVCSPPPHALVQADHSDHALTPQSTGQANVLHGCESSKAGHATPPCAAAVVIVRERICVPPPQRVEQAPNADHADTTQSTAKKTKRTQQQ